MPIINLNKFFISDMNELETTFNEVSMVVGSSQGCIYLNTTDTVNSSSNIISEQYNNCYYFQNIIVKDNNGNYSLSIGETEKLVCINNSTKMGANGYKFSEKDNIVITSGQLSGCIVFAGKMKNNINIFIHAGSNWAGDIQYECNAQIMKIKAALKILCPEGISENINGELNSIGSWIEKVMDKKSTIIDGSQYARNLVEKLESVLANTDFIGTIMLSVPMKLKPFIVEKGLREYVVYNTNYCDSIDGSYIGGQLTMFNNNGEFKILARSIYRKGTSITYPRIKNKDITNEELINEELINKELINKEPIKKKPTCCCDCTIF